MKDMIRTLPPPPGLADSPWFASPAQPDGRFANPWGVNSDKGLFDVLKWKLSGASPFTGAPPPRLPVAARPREVTDALSAEGSVQWLGHASVRVQIDGVSALIDPVFGRAGPVGRLVPAPLSLDHLPRPQLVLITHGHRDHLDAASLDALARRFGPELTWVCPLGLGAALPRGARRVVELAWWQQIEHEGVTVTLVPAQHWHQRGPADRNRALWGGYVVAGSRAVFHSGDTGYFGGFSAIGRAFPDLDLAILPLGAYEPRWFMGPQHMAPEDSVQALLDLGARRMLGMHWGTFNLTDEPADHGAFTLLPAIAEARGLPRERLVVVAHGGGLDLDGEVLEGVA